MRLLQRNLGVWSVLSVFCCWLGRCESDTLDLTREVFGSGSLSFPSFFFTFSYAASTWMGPVLFIDDILIFLCRNVFHSLLIFYLHNASVVQTKLIIIWKVCLFIHFGDSFLRFRAQRIKTGPAIKLKFSQMMYRYRRYNNKYWK